MSITEQTRLNVTNPLRHAQMLIAGLWVDSSSGETLDVENPGKRQKIAAIPRAAADVDRAVVLPQIARNERVCEVAAV